MWMFDLRTHQLDVLKTLGSIAGGIGGFLSGVAVIYSRLAAKRSKQAGSQTAATQWVNGEQRPVSVMDYAKHSATTSEAARQEITDLAEWVKGPGKRRLPTTEIQPIEKGSHYE